MEVLAPSIQGPILPCRRRAKLREVKRNIWVALKSHNVLLPPQERWEVWELEGVLERATARTLPPISRKGKSQPAC